jgi:hypothetical protein
VYSISRDALDNFVANVAATAWTLENIAGGFITGDLIPAADSKSAVLTGHVIGSADIKATSGTLTATLSGIITVTAGAATKVRVETAADGNGILVPEQSLPTGSPITVYAITRDASDNFVANVTADIWSLQNITGGLMMGDLLPAFDSKSAVFMSHSAGSAIISATWGSLSATSSGLIAVYSATGIDEGNTSNTYALKQNYPNPFNQVTSLCYQIPTRGKVLLKVYDIHGNEVATLVNQTEEAGQKIVTFDAGSLSGGTYYYRLESGQYTETRKFLLIR